EAIGMDLPPGLLASLSQSFEEVLSIHIVEIDVLTTIPAAHDVIHRTGILDAHLTWHGTTVA
ncbi:MAG TPA: hypothetical protein VL361_17260, partial [Candidatus Limnocylindrales bacterium]|nr:hypothetical protein [Candidatus Limnocylindrales bacterium]